jgi:hypothetical protein
MEYIREELTCFSSGMSTSMKKRFGFMNIAGGHLQDITNTVVNMEYKVNVSR